MASSGSQPPTTRARAASARLAELGGDGDLEPVVEAVVARLLQAGLAVSASAEAAAAAAAPAPVVAAAETERPAAVKTEADWEEELGVPSLARQHLWLDELRRQLTTSGQFGVREREEARGLLIIGESAGPPPEHRAWYWGRVRLFLVVAHHGWAAAVRDSRGAEMDRLGIRLSPAAAQAPPPAVRPVDSSLAGWRGRPSRPSGLRPPPGRAAPAAAPRRKN